MRSFIVLRLASLSIAACGLLFANRAAAADDTQQPPSPATAQSPRPAEAPKAAQVPREDAGDHPAPNSIFAEGLGAGLLYSINYERMLADEVGVRLGFGYWSVGASQTSPSGQTSTASASVITIPITASYVGIRGGKHSLELGGGATIAIWSGSASGVGTSSSGSGAKPLGVAMVGYRLHPVDRAGFQFRVGLMAVMGQGAGINADPSNFGVLPWGYLSLGASF
jgi:hypothetical protein